MGAKLSSPTRRPSLSVPQPQAPSPLRPPSLPRSVLRTHKGAMSDRFGDPQGRRGPDVNLRFPAEILRRQRLRELRRTQTMSRDAWHIRIETHMRLSCSRDSFLLQGGLRAWEGANEVCRRKFALLLAIACDDPRNASGRRYD